MDDVGSSRAARYFDEAWRRFAEVQVPVARRDYAVAGLALRLESADGSLARSVARALAHLETPPAPTPDLTLRVWDSEECGAPPLLPAWSTDDYGDSGLIRGFNDARFHIAAPYDPVPVLRLLDRDMRRAIYWTPSAPAMPEWEFGIPLRTLLHEWIRSNGRLMAHAGAVGYARGGVLLAGAGGRGKSNTALSCLVSDLLYASDDLCIVAETPDWTVHSLYSTGKMAAGDLVRHPRLAGHMSNPDALDREKALFFLHEIVPEKIIRSMPLKAVLMPEVVGVGASTLVPARAAEVQKAVATSTIEMARWTASSTFTAAARLARAVPGFRLRIGADHANVPALIARLIDRLCP